MLLLALFVVYPTIVAIQFSLNHVTITGEGLSMRFTGLDNYARAFRDPLIATAARQTLEWVIVVTLVEMLFGLGLALLVSSGIRLRSVVISVLMIPIVLPPVAVSLAWRFSYQEQFGVYNYLLTFLHLGPVRWLSDRNIALFSVMATDIWQATPFRHDERWRAWHGDRNADDEHLQDGLHPVRFRLRRRSVVPVPDPPRDPRHDLRPKRPEGGLNASQVFLP